MSWSAHSARVFSASLDQTCKVYCLTRGQLLLSVSFTSPLTSLVSPHISPPVSPGMKKGALHGAERAGGATPRLPPPSPPYTQGRKA